MPTVKWCTATKVGKQLCKTLKNLKMGIRYARSFSRYFPQEKIEFQLKIHTCKITNSDFKKFSITFTLTYFNFRWVNLPN